MTVIAKWIIDFLRHFSPAFSHVLSHCAGPVVINFNLLLFNNYFLKLDKVHNYNTRQKTRNVYFQSFVGLETGRETLHYICLKLRRDIPQTHCSFSKFKKYFKTNVLSTYCTSD